MGKLICITGIDGSGKDTLINLLKDKLESVVVADIWDSFNDKNGTQLFSSKKEIDSYLCSLTPGSRLLFLSHALKYSIDKALLSDVDYILFNAYYYKYFANEISLGADLKLVDDLIKVFPKPDMIFKINIDVELAAKRKQKLSRYECGAKEKADMESFIDAQKRAEKEWSHFQIDNLINLDARKTPEELLNEMMNSIVG